MIITIWLRAPGIFLPKLEQKVMCLKYVGCLTVREFLGIFRSASSVQKMSDVKLLLHTYIVYYSVTH